MKKIKNAVEIFIACFFQKKKMVHCTFKFSNVCGQRFLFEYHQVIMWPKASSSSVRQVFELCYTYIHQVSF